MNSLKTFLQTHLIRIAIWTIGVLIVTGAAVSYYNKQVMQDALVFTEQSNEVLKEVDRVYQNIQLMDISSRGYALIRKPEYLFWTVDIANKRSADIFGRLDSLFALQDYTSPANYLEVKQGLAQYTQMFAKMVGYLANNESDKYTELLAKDEGRLFWDVYTPFSVAVKAYEAKINTDSQMRYDKAVFRNAIIQFLLVIIGLPTLILVIFTLSKDEKERTSLLLDLETNNKEYLYNDGLESSKEAKTILDLSIQNLKKASGFVNEISTGNYDARWEGLDKSNLSLNSNNLAGRLMFMRDEMIKVKEEDRKRTWATEGLSSFSEIIRKHQQNLSDLCLQSLIYLIKYLKSQQGSIFILQEGNDEPYLNLEACYAFERKKFLKKRIEIGEGLIGQAFLEAETTLLTKLPDGYVSITSGLGESTPSCLIILPLKHNEKVCAVLEMATFKEYLPYQVAFLEKAGEFIASAIASAQNNERNSVMMAQMKSQTEQLRAQEEELRQSLEEMEATQEEMRRKSEIAQKL